MAELTLESFERACEIVKEVTLETDLIYSDYFSEMTGGKVWLKPENMQRTGAYKVLGAYYKISTLSRENGRAFYGLWGAASVSPGIRLPGITR